MPINLISKDREESGAQSSSSLFLIFCEVAQDLAATNSRLEKSRLLGEYFLTLNDEDLNCAALYLGGYLFPLRESRVVNVGGAQLRNAILQVTGCDPEWLAQRLVIHGDFGDAAFEAFENWSAVPQQSLISLESIEGQLEQLAATSGAKKKLELITSLLAICTPLEARFWVKMLQGDLRIGLKEGAVEDAIARLSHQEIGLVQRANMLTGNLGQVALLARHGRLEDAVFQLFHPLKFMLATPAADLEDVLKQMPSSFVVEDKFDGIRAQVHLCEHRPSDELLHGTVVELEGFASVRVALFSRTLDEITHSFPDLLVALARLLPEGKSGLVLDGEIVPVTRINADESKILPFQELQKRLGRKVVSNELIEQIPVAFVAYDLLFAGENELELPFEERRKRLENLDFDGNTARLCQSHIFEDVNKLDAARARGNEGLMVKDPRATYRPGRRGREWMKIKKAIATLDVVVTSVERGSGRRSNVYSDYTFAVRSSESDNTLLNIGKAYSGLTDLEIAELSKWFVDNTIQSFAHGKVRLVEPKIILEIAFDNVQLSP
jgi:DNA ligase-1